LGSPHGDSAPGEDLGVVAMGCEAQDLIHLHRSQSSAHRMCSPRSEHSCACGRRSFARAYSPHYGLRCCSFVAAW
jgi:hypothetical protein